MEKLEALVRAHPFRGNRVRTNLGGELVAYPKSIFPNVPVLSNSLHSGEILELVQAMLHGPGSPFSLG